MAYGKYKVYIGKDEPPPPRWPYLILGIVLGLILALVIAIAYQWGIIP